MARLNVVPFPASSFQSVFPQLVEAAEFVCHGTAAKACTLLLLLAACLKACPDTNLVPHSTITEHGNELGFGLPVQYDCKFDRTDDYSFGRGSS